VKGRRQGFLLFELLLVFGLVSIIACIAFVHMRFITRGYVRAELAALYQMCVYAQRCAISSGQSCAVILDIEQNRYWCNDRICTLASGVQFGIISGVKGPPSAPQQPITHASTFRNNRISCSPDGIIDAGTIYLIDADKRFLYALTAGVAPYSYVRMYRFAGTWQRLE